MHKRHHAQRQHIIHSLDTLLFQLHTLSFFLSPSLLGFISRLFSQFQCSKPRDIDPSRSLRFWYFVLVFFNFGCIWTHAIEGVSEGRAVVLDFVGQAYKPSKIHLLLLDALILFLQMLLTTIAYETSLFSKISSNTSLTPPIPALPSPFPDSAPPTPLADDPSKSSLPPPISESPYIIDLRLSHVLDRLRNPAPIVSDPSPDELLPFPNTTPWPIPTSLRMLIRARAEVRR
ncbi:hypothetical protein PILCRDRAFT_35882, partial [Piloderma croceum F 1598]